MDSEVVPSILDEYRNRSLFITYYSNHLKGLVKKESQKEDILLLEHDYKTLIEKYYPLIKQIVGQACITDPFSQEIIDNIIQQVSERMLGKEKKLQETYDPNKEPEKKNGERRDEKREISEEKGVMSKEKEMKDKMGKEISEVTVKENGKKVALFSNFIWTIIKREALNEIIRESKLQQRKLDGVDENPIETMEQDSSSFLHRLGPEAKSHIDDLMKILERKLDSFLTFRAKAIVCFKAIYLIIILKPDLEALPNIQKFILKSKQVFDQLIERLKTITDDTGKREHFSLVRPILNASENSKTDEDSYQRWTNTQIDRTVNYLNNTHGMAFDKETLKVMFDIYFDRYFAPSVQINSKVMYIDKKRMP